VELKATYKELGISLSVLKTRRARNSPVIDNSETLFLDASIVLNLKTAASGRIRRKRGEVRIWAFSGEEPPVDNMELRILGFVSVTRKETVYTTSPVSVANTFGGFVPERWGIVIENDCGVDIELLRCVYIGYDRCGRSCFQDPHEGGLELRDEKKRRAP
jgi:hypothetical protein